MIRVLHLRSSCGLYGADRALLDLAGATRLPLEPVIGSVVRGEQDELGDEAGRRGLVTWRIQSDGKADFTAANALAARIWAEDVSLVHAHDYKSLALGLVAARAKSIPVVATYHGDTSATPALIAYEALARGLANLTRGVAAVSAPLAKKLTRWVRLAKVHHIPNGIRLGAPCTDEERDAARAELGIAPEAKVVAIIGRLSVEKGHATLIDAVRRMAQRPVIMVAGEGPLRRELEVRARGLDVRWLGFVRETRKVYAAANAIAMPSLTEGLPLVGLEAMALGRPLVASAVGELPTMLRGRAGALVPPGDVDELTHALEAVLRDGSFAAELSRNALQTVRREYALDKMADRYAELLYGPALADRFRPGALSTLRTAEEGGR